MLQNMQSPLEQAYDQLYDAASDILKRDNPCDIRRDEDGVVSCSRSRRDPYFTRNHPHLCCEGCPHATDSGCAVQSLGCRLSSCTSSLVLSAERAGWKDETVIDLAQLRDAARKMGVPIFFRASKAEAFAEMHEAGRKEGWYYRG
jgi:hypothetical protein